MDDAIVAGFYLPESLIEHFCDLARNNPDLRCFDFFDTQPVDAISPLVMEHFKDQSSLLRAMEIFGIYNFAQIRKEQAGWNFAIRKRYSKVLISVERQREGTDIAFEVAVKDALRIYLDRG